MIFINLLNFFLIYWKPNFNIIRTSQNVLSLKGNSQKRKEKSTFFISNEAEDNIKKDKLERKVYEETKAE